VLSFWISSTLSKYGRLRNILHGIRSRGSQTEIWWVTAAFQGHSSFFGQNLLDTKNCGWRHLRRGAESTCRRNYSGLKRRTRCRRRFHSLDNKLQADSLARWDKMSIHYPSAIKETNRRCLDFLLDIRTFLGRGEPWDFHSTLCRFVSGSY
jgi:hypothetical protein